MCAFYLVSCFLFPSPFFPSFFFPICFVVCYLIFSIIYHIFIDNDSYSHSHSHLFFLQILFSMMRLPFPVLPRMVTQKLLNYYWLPKLTSTLKIMLAGCFIEPNNIISLLYLASSSLLPPTPLYSFLSFFKDYEIHSPFLFCLLFLIFLFLDR